MPAVSHSISITTTGIQAFNNRYVLLLSAVSALGGLLFGFDTAIISGTIVFIQPYFNLNEVSLGWAVSSILIGCAVGALFAGRLSDTWGRKKVLLLCAVLFAVTGVGTALSQTLALFVSLRMAGGLAVGAAAMVAPMYIAETVPASVRGRMVALYQLAVITGILLAYSSNYLLNDITNNWRWMFASQAAPALLFFLALFAVPETPRWLVKKSRESDALNVLQRIGGAGYAKGELQFIKASFKDEKRESWPELLLPQFRKVLSVGVVVAVFQQITGINAILYYAPEIFRNTGVSSSDALLQTIGIGVMMFLATLIAIRLVDKMGRKLLLLWGSGLMAASLITVGLCFQAQYFENYIVLLSLMVYISAFAASLGAVTWVVLSEIFPNRIRGVALSFSTLLLWIADFAVSFAFPLMNKRLGVATTLFVFATLCLIYVIYLKVKLPETKGKTLEAIEAELTNA